MCYHLVVRLTPDEVFGHIIAFVKTTNRYPTTRELAKATGLHPMTIKRKLAVLKREGKIITIPRGGSGIALPPPKSLTANE